MPLKVYLYLSLFGTAFFAAIVSHPVIGVYAYLATYNINPLGQWWGRYLPSFAERYALLLVLAIALGMLFQRAKLRCGRFLEGQEILLLLFLLVIWLAIGLGQGEGINYNVIKMTKVMLILFMASRVVTTARYFEGMIWVLIIAGLYLGYELYSGGGAFHRGRFHAGVGGSDFGEGNFLAAHFGYLLPFVGVLILKGGWKVRGLCLVAAVFMVNAIAVTRSRGAFLALAVAFAASLFLSTRLKGHRLKIVLLLVLGLAGAVQLTDTSFWQRIDTIQAESGQRDLSAQGRLDAWNGAWEMALDHPLGVGVGNFTSFIGQYQPEMTGRDTHNTYFRCLAELGFHGLAVFLAMIAMAFHLLRRIDGETDRLPLARREFFHLHAYATKLALIIYLTAALFISSIYIEELYWLLMFPVFLKRALANELEDYGREEQSLSAEQGVRLAVGEEDERL